MTSNEISALCRDHPALVKDRLVAGDISTMPTSDGPIDASHVESMWRRLSQFTIIYATGWILALTYDNIIAPTLGYQWPRGTFLFRPDIRYSDLTISWAQGNAPNPYVGNGTGFAATYFPIAYLAFRALGKLTPTNVVLVYHGLTFGALFGVWTWWLRRQHALWRGDSRWSVVIILTAAVVVCNYPLLFAVDRGNIDPITMCLMYAALMFAERSKGIVGGLLLVLASASKAFPFAAVLYWIRRRRMLAILVAVVGLLAAVIVPAMTFAGDVLTTLPAFAANMKVFREGYVLGPFSAHYSTDWLNAIRIMARWSSVPLDMTKLVPWYERVAMAWSGLLALLALFVVRGAWRELLAIVLIMLSFPNVANDYKLIFLLPPILEWLASSTRGWRSTTFCTTSALLMIPKHYYFPVEGDMASVSCIINPILLLAMSTALWPTRDEISRVCFSMQGLWWHVRALGVRSSQRSEPHAEQREDLEELAYR
jgi:hypothetical protein